MLGGVVNSCFNDVAFTLDNKVSTLRKKTVLKQRKIYR